MTIALIRTYATYSELSVAPESLSSVFFLQHSTHSVMCPSHGSHLDNNYLSSCSFDSLAVELKGMSDSQKRYMSWKSCTRPYTKEIYQGDIPRRYIRGGISKEAYPRRHINE